MKLRKIYKDTSLVIFNLLVLFLTVNFIGYFGLKTIDLLKLYGGSSVPNNPWVNRKKILPELNSEQIFQLYSETWKLRDYKYVPFSQFGEKEFSGDFVNVADAGYRKGITENSWNPKKEKFNIFVFGGSTTFGYGVPDWETVPSHLSQFANKNKVGGVEVYNFGKSAFFSTHEMLDFFRLLYEGTRPDIAIFIDGLNEFYYQEDDLIWTERLQSLTEISQPSIWQDTQRFSRKLPAYQLLDFLVNYFNGSKTNLSKQAQENYLKISSGGGLEKSNQIINRYLKNKSLIKSLGNYFGVKVLFIWQPVPTYKYDAKYHMFAYQIPNGHTKTVSGYQVSRERFDKGDFGEDVIWCADIQENLKLPLYVDAVHYSPELSRLLAKCIYEKSNLEDLILSYKY